MSSEIKIGDHVIYHDTKGDAHEALVTEVWSDTAEPLLNLVYVSASDAETDSFGRQIKRDATSVPHKSFGVHGRYWRRDNEEPNPFSSPVAM